MPKENRPPIKVTCNISFRNTASVVIGHHVNLLGFSHTWGSYLRELLKESGGERGLKGIEELGGGQRSLKRTEEPGGDRGVGRGKKGV